MDRRLLAKRLDDFRKMQNMTYEKLEDVTKIPASTLYRYLKNPPKTPDPDIVDTIARATGHTKEEAYEGLEDLPTSTGEYVAETTAKEADQMKDDLDSERNLQQLHADMLKELREHNDELRKHLEATDKELSRERNRKTGWTIAAAILAVLLAIVGMYALYAFIAFDVLTRDKGIWPFWWLK